MNRLEVEELVQNTVRKMNSGPEACLTNPRVLSFFNIMKDSFHRCLKTLAASAGTPEEKTAAYLSILTWPAERISEEVELILKRYPSVKDSYTYAAVYIVEQTYKKEGGQMKLKLPSFQSFVYKFYSTMVQSEPVQQGAYDSLQFFEKEMLTCQSFCNALYTSIKTEQVIKSQSVVIEPSEVPNNGALKSRVSKVTQKPSASSSSSLAGGAASKIKSTETSQVASASRFSMRALCPQDSVSQMKGGERKQETFRGLLTEDFLNKHRQQSQTVPEAQSQASEAAASIKKAASKKPSVRVVDIIEHPQKHLASDVDTDTSDSSTEDSESFGFQGYSRVDPRIQVTKDRKAETKRDRKAETKKDRKAGSSKDIQDRDYETTRSSRDHDDRREHSRDDDEQSRNDRHDRRGHSRERDERSSSRIEPERTRQNPNRRH
jgi:hypothetical protein